MQEEFRNSKQTEDLYEIIEPEFLFVCFVLWELGEPGTYISQI
jgi:hypothetical protein